MYTQRAKPGFWVKTGTACCKRFDAKKHLYISRNKLYLDYPHRFLLEICRNHLNNMTLYVNTAISQFGVSNGMGQWCRKTQLQHTQYIVDIPFLLSTKAACQY